MTRPLKMVWFDASWSIPVRIRTIPIALDQSTRWLASTLATMPWRRGAGFRPGAWPSPFHATPTDASSSSNLALETPVLWPRESHEDAEGVPFCDQRNSVATHRSMAIPMAIFTGKRCRAVSMEGWGPPATVAARTIRLEEVIPSMQLTMLSRSCVRVGNEAKSSSCQASMRCTG